MGSIASTKPQFVTEDSQLVSRSQSGDASAFGELVRRYQSDVRSFLRRRIADAATADDLAQEVFMGAMRSVVRFNQTSSVRSWLISIARHKLIDHFRSQSRRKLSNNSIESVLEIESMKLLESSPETEPDVLRALQKCLAALKPPARSLVDEYYFSDVTANEIAARMNQKPSTVRMSLLRIRGALAKCIRSRLGGDFEL